jgi:hypothetical protein
MSISSPRVPSLRRGDLLKPTAEVQVSTTCVDPGSRCVGRPYTFSPTVTGRVVLATSPHVTGGRDAVPVTSRRSVECHQLRPNRNHHCTLTFGPGHYRVGRVSSLPCPANGCHLNLVLSAHSPAARRGDVVVLGADQPDGTVKQNKGRLNLVLLGPDLPPAAAVHRSSDVRQTESLPLAQDHNRRVAYSVRLEDLQRGDRLAAVGDERVTLDGLPYNAFFGSELILGSSPKATKPGALGRRIGSAHGWLDAENGFNCTHGASGYESPCDVHKLGVIRIRRPPVVNGHHIPMYVNLVTRAKPLLAPAGAAGHAGIRDGGYLKVTRYRP